MWLFTCPSLESQQPKQRRHRCIHSHVQTAMVSARWMTLDIGGRSMNNLCERTLINQQHLRTQMPGRQKVKESKKGLMRELRVNCRKWSIYVSYAYMIAVYLLLNGLCVSYGPPFTWDFFPIGAWCNDIGCWVKKTRQSKEWLLHGYG